MTSTSIVRVRYAETDKMGVVYYANYLVWFEVGRTDLCREAGMTYREIEDRGPAGYRGRPDDLEVRHLVRVVTECSLLLTDVYSDERISRVMSPDRGLRHPPIGGWIEDAAHRGEGSDVLYWVRRLPDDVRVLGDKALFDLGLLGLRQV